MVLIVDSVEQSVCLKREELMLLPILISAEFLIVIVRQNFESVIFFKIQI